MEYIAVAPKSKKIKKLALMLRELDVNVYVYGPKGSGKTYLCEFIANEDFEKNIIIENFDLLKHFDKYTKRILAIGSKPLNDNLKEKFNFEINIEIPKLNDRQEDIDAFICYFIEKVKKELKIEQIDINFDKKFENIDQIKKEVYKQAICGDAINNKGDIVCVLEDYFDVNYSEQSSYFDALKIFDKALIRSVSKKYKSKTQIAKALKINRATLSKKVKEIEN